MDKSGQIGVVNMSEPTQPNPVAVPWTPDMTGQNAPAPTQVATPRQAAPVSPQPFPPQPPLSQYPSGSDSAAYQNGHVQAPLQPQLPETYAAQVPNQSPLPHGGAHVPQPPQQAYHVQNSAVQDSYVQNRQAPTAPAQPYSQPTAQPLSQQAYQPSPTAHMSLHQSQPSMMPPLVAPHVQPVAQHLDAGSVESKSFLGKLLKRSPRPDVTAANLETEPMTPQIQSRLQNRLSSRVPVQAQGHWQAPAQMQGGQRAEPHYTTPHMSDVSQAPMQSQPHATQATQASGPLFNKNFALGAVAGIIIGAFVLPMIINLIAGDSSAPMQVQIQTQPLANINPSEEAFKTEETFLDAAIAADES